MPVNGVLLAVQTTLVMGAIGGGGTSHIQKNSGGQHVEQKEKV
jgi:hypothetical protein